MPLATLIPVSAVNGRGCVSARHLLLVVGVGVRTSRSLARFPDVRDSRRDPGGERRLAHRQGLRAPRSTTDGSGSGRPRWFAEPSTLGVDGDRPAERQRVGPGRVARVRRSDGAPSSLRTSASPTCPSPRAGSGPLLNETALQRQRAAAGGAGGRCRGRRGGRGAWARSAGARARTRWRTRTPRPRAARPAASPSRPAPASASGSHRSSYGAARPNPALIAWRRPNRRCRGGERADP